jgi:hypothetical protein
MVASTDRAKLFKEWDEVMSLSRVVDEDGAHLHSLGRADGDYRTDDHDHAIENLHFSTIERNKAIRNFIKNHGEALLAYLKP